MTGIENHQNQESLRVYTLREFVRKCSQEHALMVLKSNSFDREAAAFRLKISLATLYRLLIGVDVPKKAQIYAARSLKRNTVGAPPIVLVPTPSQYAQMGALCKFFGATLKRGGSFRRVNEWEIRELFADCRKGYIQMAKQCHPDIANCRNPERMKDINLAWARLRKMFRKYKIEC